MQKIQEQALGQRAGPLDWDDLRYALAVADAGSLGAAAVALGVQHSTMLRRLDALERALGTRLFERRRQGYQATEAGELLLAQARLMQPGIAEMQRRILGQDLELQGTLRLTTAFVATLYLLPQALVTFKASHPGITVEVHENSQLVDMSRRDADVALRMSERVPEHLVGRQLGRVRSRVYARRGDPRLPQTMLPLKQLCEEHPWIGFDAERRSRYYDRWMAANVPERNIMIRMDLLHPAVALARSGMGLALLPTLIEPMEPDLVPVSEVLPAVGVPVWLLTHPDLRQTARVRAFMQEVGQSVQELLDQAP